MLRNIITRNWINELSIGIEKNFKNPSKYKCVYEKKDSKELFFDDYCNWSRIPEFKKVSVRLNNLTEKIKTLEKPNGRFFKSRIS